MGQTLGKMIALTRRARGLTLQQIADGVGVSYPAVQQWEKGKTDPSRSNALKLAQVLDLPIDQIERALDAELSADISGGEENSTPSAVISMMASTLMEQAAEAVKVGRLDKATQILEEISAFRRGAYDPAVSSSIPIRRIDFLPDGDIGDFVIHESVVDVTARPQSLRFGADAYAVRIISDKMWPKYEINDTILVNPDRPAMPGDDVLVRIHNSIPSEGQRALIRRLVHRSAGLLRLQRFNPSGEDQLEIGMVERVDRIVSWRELIERPAG
jgi:phage repressor protein C with HTH and peptisase S24 domain